MKWGSTTASGSSFRALQPSTSFKADSRTEATPTFFLNAPCGAGCLPTERHARARRWLLVSMHLLVLGAYRLQYELTTVSTASLNAPSGAGCLPTSPVRGAYTARTLVSMHLLVPGAYRLGNPTRLPCPWEVSMHLLVPGAYRLGLNCPDTEWDSSQCTFWCRVLTDRAYQKGTYRRSRLNAPSGAGCLPTNRGIIKSMIPHGVSMHLLVPGAYRPDAVSLLVQHQSLNAPSGAGCLPTRISCANVVP